jgi:two-component system LytT family response regulator
MSTAIRALLVDDMHLARQKLIRALGVHSNVEVVGEASSADEMTTAIDQLRPDLMFLDISMPEQDGLSALTEMPAVRRPLTIVLTAYAQHALEAFRLEEAVDYLLKPVNPVQLSEALERVHRRLAMPRLPERADVSPANETYSERLTLRTDSGFRVVHVDSIRWIEAIRNYLALHCTGGTLIVRGTLQGMLVTLDPARFARVHRSAIVNLDQVRELQSIGNGDQRLLLQDETRVAMSRSYRDALLRVLMR